ncbi:MAG: hypothetical protein KAI81_07045, partial [Candidatus Marinimicrobia bacterium]|nr:hypothetical protein [Candidatus Neomarinimicrobiota bacterium]
ENELILNDLSDLNPESKDHLNKCKTCKILYKEFSAMDSSLKILANNTMPIELKNDILSTIPKNSPRLIQYFLDFATILIFSLLFYSQLDLISSVLTQARDFILLVKFNSFFHLPIMLFLPAFLGVGFLGLNVLRQEL